MLIFLFVKKMFHVKHLVVYIFILQDIVFNFFVNYDKMILFTVIEKRIYWFNILAVRESAFHFYELWKLFIPS